MIEIGTIIKILREAPPKLTQKELASKVGCEREHINKVELGIQRASGKMLEAIFTVLLTEEKYEQFSGLFNDKLSLTILSELRDCNPKERQYILDTILLYKAQRSDH